MRWQLVFASFVCPFFFLFVFPSPPRGAGGGGVAWSTFFVGEHHLTLAVGFVGRAASAV